MRLALVGYGQVGQAIYRAVKSNPERYAHLDIVAIVDRRFGQDLTPPKGVQAFSEDKPAKIPWRYYAPDLVVDASGSAANRDEAAVHLESGAPRVLVTASLPKADATLIADVNEHTFDPLTHLVVSASSCTAVAFSPLIMLLDSRFGLQRAEVLVLHGYDPKNDGADVDQKRLVSGGLAAIRAGQIAGYGTNLAGNVAAVLPSVTGKIRAEGQYVPEGRALLFRADLKLEEGPKPEDVNEAIAAAAEGGLRGVICCQDDLVDPTKLLPGRCESAVFLSWATVRRGEDLRVYFGADYIVGYAARTLEIITRIGGN